MSEEVVSRTEDPGIEEAPRTQRSAERPKIADQIQEASTSPEVAVEVINRIADEEVATVRGFAEQVSDVREEEMHPVVLTWVQKGRKRMQEELQRIKKDFEIADTVAPEIQTPTDASITLREPPLESAVQVVERKPANDVVPSEVSVESNRPINEYTAEVDGLIQEYAAMDDGLRGNPPKVWRSKMRKLMGSLHPDRHPGEAKFGKLFNFVSRLKMAADGDQNAWANRRGVDFTADWKAWKNPDEIPPTQRSAEKASEPVSTEAPQTEPMYESAPPTEPAPRTVPMGAAEAVPQTGKKEEENGPKAQPKILDDRWNRKLEDDVESAFANHRNNDIRSAIGAYENNIQLRLAAREEQLNAYNALPDAERTPLVAAKIEVLEYENEMDRHALGRRQKELQVFDLEQQLVDLDKQIAGTEVVSPTERAPETIGVARALPEAGSTAMVLGTADGLSTEHAETQKVEHVDAKAELLVRRADLVKQIDDLKKQIAGHVDAIASLEKLLARSRALNAELQKKETAPLAVALDAAQNKEPAKPEEDDGTGATGSVGGSWSGDTERPSSGGSSNGHNGQGKEVVQGIFAAMHDPGAAIASALNRHASRH